MAAAELRAEPWLAGTGPTTGDDGVTTGAAGGMRVVQAVIKTVAVSSAASAPELRV